MGNGIDCSQEKGGIQRKIDDEQNHFVQILQQTAGRILRHKLKKLY